MKCNQWYVHCGGRRFRVPHLERSIIDDAVFYTADHSREEVIKSLIDHDGYPADLMAMKIVSERELKKRKKRG